VRSQYESDMFDHYPSPALDVSVMLPWPFSHSGETKLGTRVLDDSQVSIMSEANLHRV